MPNFKIPIPYYLFCVFLLTGCQSKSKLVKAQSTRFAMGTVIEITVLDTTEAEANSALEAGFAEINRISAQFWEGKPEGPIYAFNHRTTEAVALPLEILELIARCEDYSAKLDGAFDITVGTVLQLYNFKGDSLRPPDIAIIKALLPAVNYQNLIIDFSKGQLSAKNRQTKIGLGAVAKGYGVDRAITAIAKHNVAGALVNAGGDLRTLRRTDGQKWRIGIQDPRQADNILLVIEFDSGAVATSGDYEKFFMYEGKRIHHILNPRTGLPADSCQSVTVIAPTAEQADAMATGLFILGASAGQKALENFPNCEVLWICADGRVVQSAGFEKYLAKR
ncbi:MAG TPA: FAD:protein FMN transferase [Candidatus Marinimicrobia bacterium]|nr:FAD:protein FMN transferase [Candidatus Neomarinimicrobiota bacterium]HRS51535.1 FAD:protein FMN transferase [Candidatus Neomarinimicrobiota bacterium]HRU92913.1 FAD:protein FMN transferase [Candidatus Neomarinimicrobiota bacterium]